MKKKSNNGFTLIELLIVVAILGILAAIAVPAYLGQRDKARADSIIASAKGSVAETQSLLDAYHGGYPYVLLDAGGTDVCIQAASASAGRSCTAIYNRTDNGSPYSDLGDVIADIIIHHAGKNEISPFDSAQDLYVASSGSQGTVVIDSLNTRSIRIRGFALDVNPIFEDTVR